MLSACFFSEEDNKGKDKEIEGWVALSLPQNIF
jgi:hypothetical protein